MIKILNIEPSNYSEEAKNLLTNFSDVTDFNSKYNNLPDILSDYDGVIVRLGYKIDKEFLQYATKLKFVATATTGLNHIDITECNSRGIEIISLKGETDFLDTITATAEHAVGLMLSLVRKIPQAYNSVQDGKWDRSEFKGIELSGKTIGIVGYGRLGKIMSDICLSLRMSVVTTEIDTTKNYHKDVKLLSFKQLLSISDIISIHVPLDMHTLNLFNKEAFKNMKKKPYIINTSRGEIIDEDQLISNLEAGKISGAALDVLNGEVNWDQRIPKDNKILNYIKNYKNLIVTPHIGGATNDSMSKTEIFIAKKISNMF